MVKLVISLLSLSFYLRFTLFHLVLVNDSMVYDLVCLALCSFVVSSFDEVELF